MLVPAEALKNSRLRVVGARETLKQVLAERAGEVFIARDAEGKVVASILEECTRRGIPITYVDTMDALGELCGIEVSAAAAALFGAAGRDGEHRPLS